MNNIEILTNIDRIDRGLKNMQDIIDQSTRVWAALDFEFDSINRKHIMSLGQLIITYETDKINHSKIYLFDFRLFSKDQFNLFENLILINKSVVKILHGSESLDVPHLRKIMTSEQNFRQFLNQMVDTRYLCAAHHILLNKKGQNLTKCNIYDAMKNVNVITDKKYHELSSIKINYHKPWKIKKLSAKQITYAAGDVAFLFNLYFAYLNLLGEKLVQAIMESYRYVILVRFGILSENTSKKRTNDMIEELKKKNGLKDVVAKTDLGNFTLRDLLKIDYLRKHLVRQLYHQIS